MALRTENGWYAVTPDACEWVKIPGAEHVSIQVQRGQPSTLLRAYIADYHANIEPVRNNDTACYTRENSVHTSNHKSATAADINWDSHPFRVDYAGFDPEKIRRMRDLLAFYNFKGVQLIFWAQDWKSPKDAMHHQLGYNTYDNPVVAEFIRERIRSDGFSTYKRSGTAPPAPVSKQDQYALAVMAEGRRRGVTPRGIQIAFATVFVESNWKMYANSKVPESMSIPHDAVGTDHDSVGLFQQRCPMWGPAHVLMDPAQSAGLFYDRLTRLPYNDTSRPAGDFAADVQRPAAQYRGRYQERMGDAVALYNRLAGAPLPPPQGEDDLSAEAEQLIREMHRELTQRHPSRSAVRDPGQGVVDTWAGMGLNTDGNVDLLATFLRAQLGHPVALDRLRRVAAGTEPGRSPDDAKLATAILAEVANRPAAPPVSGELSDAVAENARLRNEISRLNVEITRLQVQAATPAPVDLPALAETNGHAVDTTGALIGRVYDALEELRLADALPIESRAPLAALIAVLNTKNGAQI